MKLKILSALTLINKKLYKKKQLKFLFLLLNEINLPLKFY